MPLLCCKCTEIQNISLCNVIDKTIAKYFTQAKYFTVYDETTMYTLCPLCVVNVQKCKIFGYAMLKTKLQQNISLKQNILLCKMKLQCVYYALSML